MRLSAVAIIGALAIAGVCAAQAPAGPAMPAHRSFRLRNGLTVTLVHVGTVRKAAVRLVLETGEIDEPAFGPGLAGMTSDMLLEGTIARSAQQVVSEAAALGTTVAVHSGPVTVTIGGEVETPRLAHFLSLVSDVVRHPLLDTASFGRVRRNALRALDSTLRNSGDLARQQWRAIIFPNAPFGRPYAYASTLGQLQLGHVRNIYDANYAAGRAHLYIAGVFDDAAAEATVRDIFSDWKAGAPPPVHTVVAVTNHELVVIDRPGAARSVTWLGLPTIDPADANFPKLEVADLVIAGDSGSRVAKDLDSLERGPDHGESSLWQRRGATYWVDVLDVHTGDTGSAIGAAIGELMSVRRDAPSAEELARAKSRLVETFQRKSASRDGMIDLLSFMDEQSLGDSWFTGYLQRVTDVSANDVRAAARDYLDPNKMAIVVVGDRAAIDSQLVRLRPLVP
jgi:predicted Zn-dependent peptidase